MIFLHRNFYWLVLCESLKHFLTKLHVCFRICSKIWYTASYGKDLLYTVPLVKIFIYTEAHKIQGSVGRLYPTLSRVGYYACICAASK